MIFKNIEGDYLIALSTGAGEAEISEQEYNSILDIIHNAPAAPDGFVYKLRADTLEWELVELPPAPEPSEDVDDSEALNIILGGGAE